MFLSKYKAFDFMREKKDIQIASLVESIQLGSMNATKPIKQNEKKVANLVNALYTKGFYPTYKQKYMGKKLLEEFVGSVAQEKGVLPPFTAIGFNNAGVYGIASTDNTLVLYGTCNRYGFECDFDMSFPETLSTIVHEMQHLKQFAEIKRIYQGETNVDSKYKIMLLAHILYLCKNPNPANMQSMDEYRDYLYYPLEIDARISSCEYLLNLVKNPYILPNAKADICHYLLTEMLYRINIDNVEKIYQYVLHNNYKNFKKEYNNSNYGKEYVELYKKLKPQIREYGKALGHYEMLLNPRIIFTINEFTKAEEAKGNHINTYQMAHKQTTEL